MANVKVKGSAKLFKNPVLEALTKSNPYITFIAYFPVLVGVFLVGLFRLDVPVATAFLVLAIGIFSWSISEYFLHRYLYHWINDSKAVQRFHYMMHGAHHEYPKDQSRLFMPPIPGYILAVVLFSIFSGLFLIIGDWSLTFSFFPGFIIGYLGYVYTHYSIHRFKKPKNVFGYIWDHHNIHHFKDPELAFGVSSPVWDYVFGTMPSKNVRKGKPSSK